MSGKVPGDMSSPSSAGIRWTIPISAGCRLRMLYVKGMTMTIAAGGAFNESLESLLMKEASRVAGRWLCRKIWVCLLKVCGRGRLTIKQNVRRCQKQFSHSEKSCSMLRVWDVPIKEGILGGVKRWVVATNPVIIVRIDSGGREILKMHVQIILGHEHK